MMDIAITLFAWIGLIASAVLAAATLLTWGHWACQKLLLAYGDLIGLQKAMLFYLGVTLRQKEKRGWYAGQVLASRYKELREREPEVSAEFERTLGFTARD